MTKLSFHYMIFRSSSEVTSIYCFKFLAIKKKTTSQIKKKTGRLNCKSRDIKKKNRRHKWKKRFPIQEVGSFLRSQVRILEKRVADKNLRHSQKGQRAHVFRPRNRAIFEIWQKLVTREDLRNLLSQTFFFHLTLLFPEDL